MPPQTETSLPAASAAARTWASARRIAGWCGVNRSASRALPRSTASVYCTRSFVPTERKSATSASRSATSTAAGVSTITPTGTLSAASMPAVRSAAASSATIARVASTSSTVVTSGIISLSCACAAARRIARTCGRNTSGRSRQTRIARQPRNGFPSAVVRKPAGNLSPPRSKVRMTTSCPANAVPIRAYSRTCSSSVGILPRPTTRNSVRSSPIPSARWRTAWSSSSGRSRLARRTRVRPSRVTAGWSTARARSRSSARRRASLRCAFSISAGWGSTCSVPDHPSSTTISPVVTRSSTSRSPTTAGMPIECARIAAWEVRVPCSHAMASTASRSSCTVSDGVRSRATRITGPSAGASTSGSSTPSSRVSTRISTSVRSISRSRSRVLPLVIHSPRHSIIFSSKARSAAKWFSRISRSASPMRSSSSRIMSWASKIRASSGPARSAAWARTAVMRSRAHAIASCSRTISPSTCSGWMAWSEMAGTSHRTTSAGPTATPGETAVPRIVRCGTSPPRTPPRSARRGPRWPPRHPRPRRGSRAGCHTRRRASSCP